MAKISILMPIYNGEKFLREAIQSIICQTFTDWELIIINDGSTDNSEKIIESFTDKRIAYYKNENNIGLIDTLNKGIDYCQGAYIARMDADDISVSDRLNYQFSFLEKHQQYSMCGCNAIVINDENEQIGKIINLYCNQYLQINLLFSVPFIHPSMMIRTKILKELRYDKEYKYAEDYDLWCRIAENGKVANLPLNLIRYRWHTSNVSITNSLKQEKTKNTIIIRQLYKLLGLETNNKDLFLHKITFEQHNSKERKDLAIFNQYGDLDNWFSKIIAANRSKKIFNESDLISYLWSRWIVLCVAQKDFGEILKPQFVKHSLYTLIKTCKLLYLLSKK